MRHLLLLVLLFSSACASQIKGTVYLDTNANNVPDENELTLTRVALQLVKGSTVLEQGKTDEDGRFFFKSRESGYYCIRVNEPSLQQNLMGELAAGDLPSGSVPTVNADIGVGPRVNNIRVAKQVLGGGSPAPQPAATPQKEEEKEKEEQPKPAPRFEPEPSVKSGEVCRQIHEFGADVNVGVTLDYAADVSNIPEPIKRSYKGGDLFEVTIPISLGCVLKPLRTPEGLQAYFPADAVRPDSAVANIDNRARRIEFREGYRSRSVTLHFRVGENLPVGTHSVELKPEQICPDGETIPLHTMTIDLKVSPQLVITQSLPERARAGGDMEWEVIVENRSERDVQVTVNAQSPSEYVTVDAQGLRCFRAGDRMECPAISIAAGGSTHSSPLIFEVHVNDDLDRERNAAFEASVTLDDDPDADPVHARNARILLKPKEN